MSGDILGLIDGAIEAHDLSIDAMRWAPRGGGAVLGVQAPGTLTALGRSLPRFYTSQFVAENEQAESSAAALLQQLTEPVDELPAGQTVSERLATLIEDELHVVGPASWQREMLAWLFASASRVPRGPVRLEITTAFDPCRH